MANLKLIIDEKLIEDQLWVDKYRPKFLKDIIMKQDNLNKINQWMTHFKDKKPGYKNSLLLWGPPGTGKTTIANIILKQCNYDVIEFNASDIRNQKLISKQLNDILGKKNVLDIMMNNPRNIGVIMDELDGLTTGDRGGMNELIKIMYKYRKNKLKKKVHKEEATPFICISNTINEKKFNDIKKHSIVIKISEPSPYDQTKLIERIMKSENIQIDGYNIKLLINESQGDYRRLINMMQYIYSNKDDENINNDEYTDDLKNSLKMFGNKTKYYTPYECVDKILNTYNDIDITLRFYDIDKNIIGMLFYENFLNFLLKNRKGDNLTKVQNIQKIYENYSQSDLLDNQIYIYQKWDLYDYNCVLKCCSNSFIINSMKKYSCNKSTNLGYSSLLNKTSLEYLNHKHIKLICDQFDIGDTCNSCIYICNIICDCLFKHKHLSSKAISILNNYNISPDDIEKIIKISLQDLKSELTVKKKKELKHLLDNNI